MDSADILLQFIATYVSGEIIMTENDNTESNDKYEDIFTALINWIKNKTNQTQTINLHQTLY